MAGSIKEKVFDKLPDSVKQILKDVATRIEEYKTEFNETSQAQAATSTEGTLKDGTPFKYTGDSIAKGSILTIVTEGGEVPMPDGEYVLPDDSTMVVINDGTNAVVSEIKPAAASEMGDEAKNLADVKERVTKIVEKFEAEIASVKNENKLLKVQIENLKLKQGKLAKEIIDQFSIMQAFGEMETDKPAEKPINGKPTAHEKRMALVK
jgi:hypothetical protein